MYGYNESDMIPQPVLKNPAKEYIIKDDMFIKISERVERNGTAEKAC